MCSFLAPKAHFKKLNICTYAIILFLSAFSVCAKASKIDSLQALLQNTSNDTVKFKLYQSIGYQYEFINIDSAFYYYNQGLILADKLKYAKEQGDAYLNFAFAYRYQKKYNEAIQSLQKSVAYYQSVDSISDLALAYYDLGIFYNENSQQSESINAYKKGLAYSLQIKDYERASAIYNNCGLLYYNTGKYLSAINEFVECIKLREKYNLPSLYSSLINIGLSYAKNNQYIQAIEYYKRAIKSAEKIPDYNALSIVYTNLGHIYLELDNNDSVAYYYDKSNEYNIKQGLKPLNSLHLINMGLLAKSKANFEDAVQYFKSAVKETDTAIYTNKLAIIYINLSEASWLMYNNDKRNKAALLQCIEYAKKTIFVSSKLNLSPKIIRANKVLIYAYEANNNYKSALQSAHLYIDLSDSILSKEKTIAVLDIQTKYETEKKELEIELLNSKNLLNENKLIEMIAQKKRQYFIIIVVVVGLITTLVFVLLLSIQIKKRKKANSLLAQNNLTISKQNDEKEILLKEIHHRVKNNLQIVSSLLELQANRSDEKTKEILADGQNRLKSMSLIHEKLYQNKNLGEILFDDYVKQLAYQIASIFPLANKVKQTIVKSNIKLDIDTAVPIGLILNELITNAYKYAFKENEGQLIIKLTESAEGNYLLTVSDSGPGLQDDFDWKHTKTLGLRLVGRLTRQLYGKVEFRKNDFSTFELSFKSTKQRRKVD